jgi:hypothetical protein
LSEPRLKAIAVVYTYDDGSTKTSIVIDCPQIHQVKREEQAGGDPVLVRYRLDVIGVDRTEWRELTPAQLELPAVPAKEGS